MRVRPIQLSAIAATAMLASPALAQDDYPGPGFYEAGADYANSDYQGPGEVRTFVLKREAGDEVQGEWREAPDGWHELPPEVQDMGDGHRRTVRVIERYEGGDAPMVMDHSGGQMMMHRMDGPMPRQQGHMSGYSEQQRAAWLGECRARIRGGRSGRDECGEYLAAYESGNPGAFSYSQSYSYSSARGCGCGCGCGCNGGCGGGYSNGGGGCGYSFAPIPAMPMAMPVVHQAPKKIRRIITTEEWVETETVTKRVPGKVVPTYTKPVEVKPQPTKPIPTKQAAPRYSK